MALFYDSTIKENMKELLLSEEESKHVCKVLRLKEGDEIELLNGSGLTCKGTIIDAHPKKCMVALSNFHQSPPLSYSIHIAIAPTKNMDRLEWFFEKATEIGITEITLLQCSNSERKQLKIERLEKILISAMKQSQRTYLPILHDLVPYNDFVETNNSGLIAHCYEAPKTDILDALELSTDNPILIGPEGDFSREEVQKALEKGYKTISLGENRLRTETAGLYACTAAKLKIDQKKKV